jgi:hypothetical protein
VTDLRLPHFIIGGAPRTATTWLYELANLHPEIAMARPLTPEPKFFLVDSLYERGLPYYAATWFDPLPAGRRDGEKTTNYLESGAACVRIARDLPGVRLIFLLRDPVERAHSNYLWSTRNGFETETFARGLELEAERERDVPPELRYARPHAYFSRGLYADLLRPWLARFPREHVLVLRTEDVAAAPRGVASTLHRFLGIAERPDLAAGLAALNAARPDGAPAIDPSLRAELSERYRQSNADLAALLGPAFATWERPAHVGG